MKKIYNSSLIERIFIATSYSLVFPVAIKFLIYPLLERPYELFDVTTYVYFAIGFIINAYLWIYRRNYVIVMEDDVITISRGQKQLGSYSLVNYRIYLETTPLRVLVICSRTDDETFKEMHVNGQIKRYILNVPRKGLYELQHILRKGQQDEKIDKT